MPWSRSRARLYSAEWSFVAPVSVVSRQPGKETTNSLFSLPKLFCDQAIHFRTVHFGVEHTQAMQRKHSCYLISFIYSFDK